MSRRKTTTMDTLIASLRALVISRKEPTTVGDLVRDYRAFEGQSLKAETYGYDTVEDLLKSSGKFILNHKYGKTHVKARSSESTAHIEQMVQKQKPAKKSSNQVVFDRNYRRRTPPPPKVSLVKCEEDRNVKYEKNYNPKRREVPPAPIGLSWPARDIRRHTPPPPWYFDDSDQSSDSDDYGDAPPPPRWIAPPNFRPKFNCDEADEFGSTRSSTCYAQDQKPEFWRSTQVSFSRNFGERIDDYRSAENAIALEVFCSMRNIASPWYRVHTRPERRGFFCQLRVSGAYYYSGIMGFSTVLEAKLECARKAVEDIFN